MVYVCAGEDLFVEISQKKNILDVDITEWTVHGAHQSGQLLRWVRSSKRWSKVHYIIESTVAARRAIIQGNSPRDGILSVLDILHLPHPPGTIDLSVMKPESGISWGSEDISTWVTSEGEMTSSMYTEESF
jgi:hypothetical protein